MAQLTCRTSGSGELDSTIENVNSVAVNCNELVSQWNIEEVSHEVITPGEPYVRFTLDGTFPGIQQCAVRDDTQEDEPFLLLYSENILADQSVSLAYKIGEGSLSFETINENQVIVSSTDPAFAIPLNEPYRFDMYGCIGEAVIDDGVCQDGALGVNSEAFYVDGSGNQTACADVVSNWYIADVSFEGDVYPRFTINGSFPELAECGRVASSDPLIQFEHKEQAITRTYALEDLQSVSGNKIEIRSRFLVDEPFTAGDYRVTLFGCPDSEGAASPGAPCDSPLPIVSSVSTYIPCSICDIAESGIRPYDYYFFDTREEAEQFQNSNDCGGVTLRCLDPILEPGPAVDSSISIDCQGPENACWVVQEENIIGL